MFPRTLFSVAEMSFCLGSVNTSCGLDIINYLTKVTCHSFHTVPELHIWHLDDQTRVASGRIEQH